MDRVEGGSTEGGGGGGTSHHIRFESSNVSEETGCATPRSSSDDGNDNTREEGVKKNKNKKQQLFQYPSSFLLRIPKADLHAHLDGSIRIETLCDLAKEQNIPLPSYDPEQLKNEVFPDTYASLEEYLRGFGYITTVLRTPQALERVAYEVSMDAYNVGVRYIELRFAPQLHAVPGKFSIEEVVCSVNRGMERAVREGDELDRLSGLVVDNFDIHRSTSNNNHENYDEETIEKLQRLSKEKPHPYHPDAPSHHYGIIVCAMRFFLPIFSPYYEAFWEVHKGEDPHRVFGLASVALVTAVNNLRRKGRCCHHHGNECGGCGDCLFGSDIDRCEGYRDDNLIQQQEESLVNGVKEKEEEGQHLEQHEYILPIVAMDVAGAESGYPASDHKEAFDLAHQSFLNKTVHAGEAYGAESIFSAITDLHAERIGHGCNLFRWDIIGEGEGRGGRSKSKTEKEEMSDDDKRAYVENLTRYLGVSIDSCCI